MALTIDRPENDPAFAALTREREKLHTELEELGAEIEEGRGRLDEWAAASAVGMEVPSAAERQKFVGRINQASAKREEAKRRLRELADQLPHARQAAARKVSAKVAPVWNKAARAFLLARLTRLAPEIAAAAEMARLRPEISARMVPFLGMALSYSAIGADREFAALRDDVVQALEFGVLKPSDLPGEVRKVWGK